MDSQIVLHLMVTEQGQPVEFFLTPGSWSDTKDLKMYQFDSVSLSRKRITVIEAILRVILGFDLLQALEVLGGKALACALTSLFAFKEVQVHTAVHVRR